MEQETLFPGLELPPRELTVHPALERYGKAVYDYIRDQEERRAMRALASSAQATLSGRDGQEVATVERAEFLQAIQIKQYPNFSSVINYRSNGEYISFYDTMLGTDPDLRGLAQDIIDDLLHNDFRIWPADETNPEYQRHAQFVRFALAEIPHFQNFVDHALGSHMRGFAVSEKIYRLVLRGAWAGAVVYDELLDTPQRWWNFDLQRQLLFRTIDNPVPGVRMPPGKFVVITHGSNSNPWGHPVLDDAYWCWYLKHFALKNQAIFFEKWAMPTPRAKYKHGRDKALNDARIASALKAIQSFQTDGGVVVPEEIELDLIESIRQGAVSYEGYINQLTEMESRAVTGQILTMFGAKGGSYALGKVHEKRISNKVSKLAAFISSQISRQLVRDLIDRNFGPQDAYPKFEYDAMDALEKQAEAEVEKALQQNGHDISKSASQRFFKIIPPTGPGDILTPPLGAAAAQTLPVNPTLAAPEQAAPVMLAARTSETHDVARAAAKAHRAKLDSIAAETAKDAGPAIRKVVKGLGATVKSRKKVEGLKRAELHRGVRSLDLGALGSVMHRLISKPDEIPPAIALAGEQPPDISTSAKLALALQVYEIVERIYQASKDAPAGMTGADFATALTDETGLALDQALTGSFTAVHPTNIATVATARLRAQLSDPAFRQSHPYVMIVSTNPGVRLSHKVMDGFILSAEDALYSPFLPPFDFGCDCVPVAITAEQARAAGWTGAAPAGTLEQFLAAQGVRKGAFGEYATSTGQTLKPGPARGFAPAFRGTDTFVQLEALRAKAGQIQNEDPEAWAQAHAWLLWLFGLDVLKQDPPQEDQNVAA